jgi:hypothetical protein
MSRLLASLDAPPSGRACPTWFDAAAYGRAKLLGGGDVPWDSPAELSFFFAKIGGMFRSDAILVDVADIFAQRAAADQRLRAAMAARSRPGYALRTLLGDEQARATAVEAVRVLAATSGSVPLVLTVPAPGRWLVAAARQAGSDPGPPDAGPPGAGPPDAGPPDEGPPDAGPLDAGQAETAAMYSADFLRLFAGTGVDGLLLDEGRVPAGELIHPEAYRPVLNVADHYEWPVLIQTAAAAAWPHGPVPDVAVWLGSAAPGEPAGHWGLVADADFWDGVDPPTGADLVLAPIPVAADPEAVMKRVRALA